MLTGKYAAQLTVTIVVGMLVAQAIGVNPMWALLLGMTAGFFIFQSNQERDLHRERERERTQSELSRLEAQLEAARRGAGNANAEDAEGE